jgi:glycine/D-amino acid oxidase-like deaminating enzyme
MSGDAVRMRDVVVIGGGCYGTFYATQLARAKAKGKANYRRVLLVDRDPRCRAGAELPEAADRQLITSEWDAFFDRFLGAARPAAVSDEQDYIVPSPHMPHLMFEWVLRRSRARFVDRQFEVVPVPESLDTPYDRTAADRTRYVSFADWVCPTHCIEPAICPAIGRARTWEMPDAVRALAERLRAGGKPVFGPALFVCRHHVYGVGTFAVDAVLEGERILAEAAQAEGATALIGTVSSCHGALNLVRVGRHQPDG